MDPTQILLVVVVTVLTLLLVAVGAQVFLVLKEAREALVKVNTVLQDAASVSQAVSRPILGFANFIDGMKKFKTVIEELGEQKQDNGKNEKEPEKNEYAYEFGKEPNKSQTKDGPPEEVLEATPQHVSVERTVEEKVLGYPQHAHIASLQERGRRFFHKDGKPLTS